ncbi:hypothetical protein VTN77DRAFT_6217 [Rasamsonia byssochlamydoides]|uniref:uncharacterized protein n=1 Tax=Rasamsonia byssochlamydoides TaxID=89139 RepID=UPI0037443448
MAAVHHLIPPELAPVIRNYGYGLTIWSPLDNGILTGKYNDGIPEGSRLTGADAPAGDKQNMINMGKALSTPAGQAKIQKVRELGVVAQQLGCTTAQLPLAWCLCNENVSTVITGASRPEQVAENMKALDVYERIKNDAQILDRIEKILDNKPAETDLYGRWA